MLVVCGSGTPLVEVLQRFAGGQGLSGNLRDHPTPLPWEVASESLSPRLAQASIGVGSRRERHPLRSASGGR
jgi:hypothetical protein